MRHLGANHIGSGQWRRGFSLWLHSPVKLSWPARQDFFVQKQNGARVLTTLKDTVMPAKESQVAGVEFIKKIGWDPDSLRASKDFNRYVMVPAATMNHLCLGSIFAWSIFNAPLMRLNGVVAPASTDWALGDISITFSLVMGGFAWGAVFGKYLDAFGPRVSCLIGATSLFSGFSLASTAVMTQNLPLLYLGGAIWGIANGWAYVPPVASLVQWFPERKGLASGMCILGYGGGAMIAAPLFSNLLDRFRVDPAYAGHANDLDFVNQQGKLFLETVDGLREVVVATTSDLKSSGLTHLMEGAYFVGTGSTGVAETFAVLGIGYGLVMAATSFAFRLPPENYIPPGLKTNTESSSMRNGSDSNSQQNIQLTHHNITASEALRTPQFWLLYAGFGCSIVGTYGLLSCGKLMISETFGPNLPDIVTPAFTSTFVAAMSAANLSGRVFWPAVSDYLAQYRGGDPFYARKYTFSTMWATTPLLYAAIVGSIHECVENPGVLPLAVFGGSVLGILGVFGGTTAGRPALVADIYGLKSMSVITARQLSVVLPAAFLGPQIVAHYRKESMDQAIFNLSEQVDENAFHHAFGTGKDQLAALIDSKTVTISRLVDLLPHDAHFHDPTPFLYDKSMYIMAGCQMLALLTNFILRPVKDLEPPK